MTRPTSTAANEDLNAENSEGIFLALLTVTHPQLSTPIRLANNEENITSRGNVYQKFAFELRLPRDSEATPPRARARIDNVDQQIVTAIRLLDQPAADILIEIIRAADPDVVEWPFPTLKMVSVSWDALIIDAEIIDPDLDGEEPYPQRLMTERT